MSLFIILLVIYLIILIIGHTLVTKQLSKRRYWQSVAEPLVPCAFQKSGNYLKVKEIHGQTNQSPIGYVAFSLFGNYKKYSPTLYKNLECIPRLMPGWRCRVYVGIDVSSTVLNEILRLNGEVHIMDGISKNFEGATWRFLPAQEDVVFITRDADDVFNFKDAENVVAWCASGKRFFLASCKSLLPMQAGLWGGRNKCVPDMWERLDRHCTFPFGFDEHFLRQEIYPLVEKAGYYEVSNISYRLLLNILFFALFIFVFASLAMAYRASYARYPM